MSDDLNLSAEDRIRFAGMLGGKRTPTTLADVARVLKVPEEELAEMRDVRTVDQWEALVAKRRREGR